MSDNRHKTVQETVANKIASSGPEIEKYVVDGLVHLEVKRRTEIITTAVGFISNAEKNFRKLNNPDGKQYVGDEKTEQITYSDKRIKDIKKAQEDLEKVHRAFDKALVNNKSEDYDELAKLLKAPTPGGDSAATA